MEHQKKLRCPSCGKEHTNYKEFFNCWTGHLLTGESDLLSDVEINDKGKQKRSTTYKKIAKQSNIAPFKHDEAVQFYKLNPAFIEDGLHIIGTEISVFRGRIDLIGIDRERRLILIDVTDGHEWKQKTSQLKTYAKSIMWMGSQIFGLMQDDMPKIRLLVVKPNDYVKDLGIINSNGISLGGCLAKSH